MEAGATGPTDAGAVRVPGWYCLRAQPKHEHIAALSLRREGGIEVFCPRIRFRRRTVRGVEWVTEALFPGYLFARFDLTTERALVGFSRGVRGVLQFGGRAPRVEDVVIEGLRAGEGPSEVRVIDSEPRVGGEVEILGGALDGLQAVVSAVLPARERVRVLLEFLGRVSEVELERGRVMAPVDRRDATG